MKLKEKIVETKKNVKAWWNDHKDEVIVGGAAIAGAVSIEAISYLFGKETGLCTGRIEGRKEIWGPFNTKALIFINGRDDDGNFIGREAITTRRFYNAFQHPEKIKWYDDETFEYVDELKED